MSGRLILYAHLLSPHLQANEITAIEQSGVEFKVLCNCAGGCLCKPEILTYYGKDPSSASTLDVKICRCRNGCVCDPLERGIEISGLIAGYLDEYRKTNPPDMTLAQWLAAMDRSAL